MKNLNLDDFEQDILDSVENNEWQSKGDIKIRLTELQGFLKNEKKKAISIRLSENDLYEKNTSSALRVWYGITSCCRTIYKNWKNELL